MGPMATVRLPEHSHCRYCGDPVPFGEEYCNDSCRDAEIERERKDKMRDMLFYVSAGIAIIAILAVKILAS